VPTKVTASIDIPRSYYVKVWQEQQPSGAAATKQPDAAELDKIETATVTKVRETVRNLLPTVATGTDPYPHIVVSSYTDLPSGPLPQPTLADNSLVWIAGNWQTVALVVVGLFALLTVRNLAKGAMAPPPATSAAADAMAGGNSNPSPASEGAPNEEDEPEVAHVLKRKFGGDTPNLKEELAGLVKDDPDAAATILRAWIGEAA
jgi:flagellar M-ring protein FliF